MLDHRTIHNLMQNIDDKWIEQAIYADRKRTPFHKFITAAAIIFICVLISTSVVSAISPTFKQWLLEQFPGHQPKIEQLSLPEGINRMENGFLLEETDDGITHVYYVDKGGILPCEPRLWNSCIIFQDKRYDVSFRYVKNGKNVYAWDYQGAAINLTGYDESTGILYLSMDDIQTSYYIHYDPQTKPSPVVDPYDFEELWKLHIWNDNEVTPEGKVNLSDDMHVSPDGKWLLYRSNRNYYMYYNYETGTEDQIWSQKGEWYVRNIGTGEETLLPYASSYLHDNEVGFVDNSIISILWAEVNDNHPILYNCASVEIKKITPSTPNSSPYSIHYELQETEKEYVFWNYYKNEGYKISKTPNAQLRASYATENIICLMDTSGSIKFYFTNEQRALTFGKTAFEDIEEVWYIYDLGEDRFVLTGTGHGKPVGYLLEF